jgi:hypothetical protein
LPAITSGRQKRIDKKEIPRQITPYLSRIENLGYMAPPDYEFNTFSSG